MTTSRKKTTAASRAAGAGQTDPHIDPYTAPMPMDAEIRRFLAGETNGRVVLEALYDHVLDEPVPQRLKDLWRK
jgi:hypothetical protein